MANKIKSIPSKAREILEAVVSEFGIEVIEDYIKNYKKQQRKRMKRHNTKEEIAYNVYNLIFNEKYSRTRAIEKIAIEKNISDKTINNHLNNFSQEAKKNEFYTLGWIVDKIYNYYNTGYSDYKALEYDLTSFASENDLEKEILEAYYWKYKTLSNREKTKYQIELSNIKIPNSFKDSILKKYFPQNNKNEDIQINEDDIPF